MAGIIRPPTVAEKKDFIPLVGGGKNAEAEFVKQVHAQKNKANKKGLPFCDAAAKQDWEELSRQQRIKLQNKYGYIKWDEFKQPTIDWEKYSDVKNFKLLKEDKRLDRYQTNKLNREVWYKYRVYQYKGFEHYTYTIMEPYENAWEEKPKGKK